METKQVRFFLFYRYVSNIFLSWNVDRFVCSELAKKEGVELIKNNDELFWAVMGGSPGNFGILTHVTFRPLHDKDYPDSRMMRFTIPYTAERHRNLETLLLEMNDDDEVPGNFNLFYTILGKSIPATVGPKYFDLIKDAGGGENLFVLDFIGFCIIIYIDFRTDRGSKDGIS